MQRTFETFELMRIFITLYLKQHNPVSVTVVQSKTCLRTASKHAEGKISLLQENSLEKGYNIMASNDFQASAAPGPWVCALRILRCLHKKFAAYRVQNQLLSIFPLIASLTAAQTPFFPLLAVSTIGNNGYNPNARMGHQILRSKQHSGGT